MGDWLANGTVISGAVFGMFALLLTTLIAVGRGRA